MCPVRAAMSKEPPASLKRKASGDPALARDSRYGGRGYTGGQRCNGCRRLGKAKCPVHGNPVMSNDTEDDDEVEVENEENEEEENGDEDFYEHDGDFWVGDRVYVKAAGWGAAFEYEVGGFRSGGAKVMFFTLRTLFLQT